MAVLVECDICGAQHRVKDALSGGSMRCRECGVHIKILKENVITPDAFVEVDGRLIRRQPERQVAFWSWILGMLVSTLVAVTLVVVVWAIMMLVRI